jgi:hypothetical protein
MKTRLVKSIMAPLLFACALVPMVAITATGQGTEGGRIQGTWEMQLTRTDCNGHAIGTGQSIAIFMQGGTMIESQRGVPQAFKTPGEGVWSHTTDNTYALRFKYFTFNAQNAPTGWVIVSAQVSVDESGNANAGSATIEVYDPNGVLVATACADVVGTRFGL